MGLYDSVDRGKPKPKRLTGPIALCCALFLLFGGLTYWACHHQFRFHAFISDLTDSTRDARSTETFRVTVNGSETDVSIDDLSDLLYLIDKAGAGRTAAAPEEMPYAVIDYGDVIVHIFNDETRLFYHLERLWEDGGNLEKYEEAAPEEK